MQPSSTVVDSVGLVGLGDATSSRTGRSEVTALEADKEEPARKAKNGVSER